MSQELVDLVDRLTLETAAKLRALGDVEQVTEVQLESGMGIDYATSRPTVLAPLAG